MNVATVQSDHPLNRPAAKAMAPLAGADFRGRLDALMGDQQNSALPTGLHSSGELRPLSPRENIPGLKGDLTRPLEPLNPPPPPLLPLDDLDRVPGQRQSSPAEQDQVAAMARKWVAQTFYGTLFRQMRNSPFKSELFDGGRGGQAFAPLLDQHLIDHMSRGAGNKLTNAIARKLMGNRAASAAPAAAPRPSIDPNNPYEHIQTHVAPNLRA